MAFDIKRAESIASGFKEWIHTRRITYDNAVEQVKKTYREDMAKEIIRILEHDIKEIIVKCRWALVFDDVEEAERARERLSWHHIYPDSQEENKLLWIDRDEVGYAREHVGGLIEEWTPRGGEKIMPEKKICSICGSENPYMATKCWKCKRIFKLPPPSPPGGAIEEKKAEGSTSVRPFVPEM